MRRRKASVCGLSMWPRVLTYGTRCLVPGVVIATIPFRHRAFRAFAYIERKEKAVRRMTNGLLALTSQPKLHRLQSANTSTSTSAPEERGATALIEIQSTQLSGPPNAVKAWFTHRRRTVTVCANDHGPCHCQNLNSTPPVTVLR